MTKKEIVRALEAKRIIHAISCVASSHCTCGYSELAEMNCNQELGEIRSAIEGIARELEAIGRKVDADNIRRASAKFYMAGDKTMLQSTLDTGQLILKKERGRGRE